MIEAKPNRPRRKVGIAERVIAVASILAMGELTSLIIPEGDVHIDGQSSYARAKFFSRSFIHVDLEKGATMTGVTGCVFTKPDPSGETFRVFSRKDNTNQGITPFVEWRDGTLSSRVGDMMCMLGRYTDQDKAYVGAIEREENIDR